MSQAPAATEAELEVLKALWAAGPMSVRQIVEFIHGSSTSSRYGATQSYLDRLEAKGFVKRDRETRPQVFIATVDETGYTELQITNLADQVFEGRLPTLLATLLGRANLSAKDLQELRRIIKEAEEKS